MQIYADNAATTKMSAVALKAMEPYLTEVYGNPSSLHSMGQRAKEALDQARQTIADCLGCEPKGHFVCGQNRRAQGKETHHLHCV